jgi:hypothetical protein
VIDRQLGESLEEESAPRRVATVETKDELVEDNSEFHL